MVVMPTRRHLFTLPLGQPNVSPRAIDLLVTIIRVLTWLVLTTTDPIVELVLKHNPAWVNAQDGRGQTPLHLASALNRVDIVALFLLQESVDDMIRDSMGKTAADVAGGPDTSTLISGQFRTNADDWLLQLTMSL